MAWKYVETNAGTALLAQYAQGGHTLILDGATVAKGIIPEANMRIATALTDEVGAASIISARAVENGTRVKIQVGPSDTTEYTAHQIGLWAKLDNGQRTLLGLAQDSGTGVGVPTRAVSPNFAFAIFLAMAISNNGELTVNIDQTAFVTVGTLEDAIDDAVEDVLTTEDVANDLTTTEAGKVLDARQGNALNQAIGLKANKAEVYTQAQIDAALANKADAADVYSKNDVYTKTEVDAGLSDKADASAVYTKAEVDTAVDAKAARHVFNVTVPVTGWEAYQSALYRVTEMCPGIVATDACGGASPVQTGTETDDKAIRKAWGRVTRIVAGAGSITVYATKIPEVAIPVQIEVFR